MKAISLAILAELLFYVIRLRCLRFIDQQMSAKPSMNVFLSFLHTILTCSGSFSTRRDHCIVCCTCVHVKLFRCTCRSIPIHYYKFIYVHISLYTYTSDEDYWLLMLSTELLSLSQFVLGSFSNDRFTMSSSNSIRSSCKFMLAILSTQKWIIIKTSWSHAHTFWHADSGVTKSKSLARKRYRFHRTIGCSQRLRFE